MGGGKHISYAAKFPTVNGIGVVDEAQTISRETYKIATAVRSWRQAFGPNKHHEYAECLQIGAANYGFITGAIQLGSLDPRDKFYEQRGSPVEELEEIQFSLDEPEKTFKIRKLLH